MIHLLKNWLTEFPIVRACVWLQVGLAAIALVAMPFDKRELLGLNVWVKPLKFDLSILIVLITFAAFLSSFDRFATARSCAGNSLAIALSIENVLISFQGLRGVRSHMNYTSEFNARMFMFMGLLAVVATLAAVWVLGLSFVAQPRWAPAVTWGIRLGILMFLVGSVEGVLMVTHGGHTVGAADGLQGLPLVNWSRRHGDLRIAHFFALHAVQAFPCVGYLCSRLSWGDRTQIAAVFLFSIVYTAAVWLLFKQAMQGHALV